MKTSLKIKLLLLFLIGLQSNALFAWNAAGHQLLAAISWELLTNKEQDYWVDILKHHPRFNKDFKQNIPKYVKKHPHTYNEWVFRQAAVWPDIARGFQQKQKDKYHHGSWHYINYPVYLDKKVNTKFLNLNRNWKHKFHNNLNITQALKGNLAVLAKQGASKREQALALAWVLHLAGDSHQPLHSSALFSSDYFPKGDRGGNLIAIKGQGQINNLHWYWDSRLDHTTSFKIIDLKAKKLTRKYSKIASKQQNSSIDAWLQNTNALAKKYVYTPSLLATIKLAEQQNQRLPTVSLSGQYDNDARTVSEQQIVIAAFQLAKLLKTINR